MGSKKLKKRYKVYRKKLKAMQSQDIKTLSYNSWLEALVFINEAAFKSTFKKLDELQRKFDFYMRMHKF